MQRMLKARFATYLMVVALSACAPDVYKDDIGKFSSSVGSAVDAFELLRHEVQKDVTATFERDLAERGVRVQTVGDCTGLVTDQLQRDSTCLANWASYRATPADKRGDPPSCQEPARNHQTNELEFYDLSKVKEAEIETCRLGVLDGSVVRPDALDAGGVLENTAQIGDKLKQYAASLSELADSQDSDELKAAVGDAKTALEGLADRTKTLTNEEIPGRAAIGPVADLLGAALVATLETRRFVALRNIVRQADPVVENAAQILSRNSMPLMIPKLRATGTKYVEATEVFNNEPTGDAWVSALVDARAAKDEYLRLYDSHPAVAFQAMAKAHAALKGALEDPERQFETMKATLEDFGEKAKAAYDAVKKAQDEEKKEQS